MDWQHDSGLTEGFHCIAMYFHVVLVSGSHPALLSIQEMSTHGGSRVSSVLLPIRLQMLRCVLFDILEKVIGMFLPSQLASPAGKSVWPYQTAAPNDDLR